MTKIRTLKAKNIIRALRKLGFYQIRQKGSHIFFIHRDGRNTLVPKHGGEDISKGLLRQILREIKISPEEFLKYL